MRRSPVLAALLLLAAGSAPAQESRLDPLLRSPLLVRQRERPHADRPAAAEPAPVLSRPALPFAAPLARTAPGAAPVIRVLVRLAPGGEAALERLGATIGARAGDIVTARLPLDAIPALAADPAIRFTEAAVWLEAAAPPGAASPGMSRLCVSPSPRRRSGAEALGSAGGSEDCLSEGRGMRGGRERVPQRPEALPSAGAMPADPKASSDTGSAALGLDRIRRRSGDRFFGLAGQGVVIGIVDTGIDLAHEDFRDAAGRTRVLYAWDQSAGEGRPPGAVGGHTLDYGAECGRAAIDAGACALADGAGHGTHVAGIAAGDGSATGHGLPAYRYTGVAPAADLIVVKAGEASFTSERLLDGVAYIFARAAELGRPAVVNLSVSTQAGPHDGTTLLERGLDQLSGPGRIIVAGAGNQGVNANEEPAFVRAPIHAMGALGAGAAASHALVVPPYAARPGALNDGAVLELWYDGHDTLAVEVVSPRGDRVRAVTGDTVLALTPAGAVYIDNASAGPNATNGDHLAMIALADMEEGAPPDSGRWSLAVSRAGGGGSGAYHLWLVGGAFQNPLQLARLEGGTTNSHVVGSPATADRVIAVAAYANRHEWRTAGGEARGFPVEEPLGDIAFFSSPGPRRDGALKPEIAAPGKMVIAARAAQGKTWSDLPWLVEEDGVHGALLGTSMAAPHVAGAIALLLQLDPRLTPEAARELVAGSARQDAFTRAPGAGAGEPARLPNSRWGHGKLDAGAAVQRLRDRGGLTLREQLNLSANPVRGDRLVINYPEPPLSLALYTYTGDRVRSFGPDEVGDLRTTWSLANEAGRPVANGAYLLVADFVGERVLKKIFVLRR